MKRRIKFHLHGITQSIVVTEQQAGVVAEAMSRAWNTGTGVMITVTDLADDRLGQPKYINAAHVQMVEIEDVS